MRCTRPVLERCKTGPIEVLYRPCGKCPACLSNKAQEWVYRLYAESKLHAKSVFVTLTYDKENIKRLKPGYDGLYSLDKRELQNFMKRLRKIANDPIRFYGVGEYGGTTYRPHYHLIVFGLGPEDESLIQRAWSFGFISVGSVSPSSIAYVARYCTKKLFKYELDYKRENILPEFSLMSRNPGIGLGAIDKAVKKNEEGLYYVWFNGRRTRVPKYFADKIRSAYEIAVGRNRAQQENDSRINSYEQSGKSQFLEELQAERNTLARQGLRKKL